MLEASPCGGGGDDGDADPCRGAGGASASGGPARAALLQSYKNTWNKNGNRLEILGGGKANSMKSMFSVRSCRSAVIYPYPELFELFQAR